MKKKTFAVVTIALMLAIVSSLGYAQQTNPSSQGGWYCPWMGQSAPTGQGAWCCPGMGAGHHQGQMMAYCPMYGGGFNQTGQPLTKEQAQQLVADYVRGNPNLKVADVTDKGNVFEAVIVTNKEGALVEKIQVDKNTGWFRSAS
jgi:hypothetical protein